MEDGMQREEEVEQAGQGAVLQGPGHDASERQHLARLRWSEPRWLVLMQAKTASMDTRMGSTPRGIARRAFKGAQLSGTTADVRPCCPRQDEQLHGRWHACHRVSTMQQLLFHAEYKSAGAGLGFGDQGSQAIR